MKSGTLERGSQYHPRRWFCETSVPSGQGSVRDNKLPPSTCTKYLLWIDGVGGWQLCTGSSFVIGAPSFEQRSADIALLANISRLHTTVSCSGENWRLQAHQETSVSGRQVADSCNLRSGDQICLAGRVKLGFRIPSVLSTSAVIDFESDHRPSHSLDGIILLSDHCLLGPRRDHHIFCEQWPDLIVLFEQNGELRCRSDAALYADDRPVRDSAVLKDGTVVTGDELRFRVEVMQ